MGSAIADKLVAEGVALFNAGKPFEAIERFRQAVREGRDTVDVRCYEAQCLHSAGQGHEAVAVLTSLARRAPQEARVWQNLASVLRLEKKEEQAAVVLHQALRRHPGHAGLSQALRELERERALKHKAAGREAAAAAAWRRVLTLDAGNPEAKAALAERARAKSPPRRLPRTRPRPEQPAVPVSALRRESLVIERALRLLMLGRVKQAAVLCRRLAAGPCIDKARVAKALAEIESRCGWGPGTKLALRRALARLPKGESSALHRLRLLLDLGRYPEAFAQAERCLDGAAALEAVRMLSEHWPPGLPDELRDGRRKELERLCLRPAAAPWARYLLGGSQTPPDIAQLRRVKEFPESRYGWMRVKLAWALLHEGRYEETTALLARGARWRPLDWRGFVFSAQAWAALRRPAEAARALERAREFAPTSEKAEASAWRGALELWLGRYPSALKLLTRAQADGAGLACGWRGAALVLLGRPREALPLFEEALRLRPDDAEASFWKAEAFLSLGRPREALAALQGRGGFWAKTLKALALAEAGEWGPFRGAYEELPRSTRDFLGRRRGTSASGPLTDAERVKRLRLALSLAKGYRGEEAFGQCLWMS